MAGREHQRLQRVLGHVSNTPANAPLGARTPMARRGHAQHAMRTCVQVREHACIHTRADVIRARSVPASTAGFADTVQETYRMLCEDVVTTTRHGGDLVCTCAARRGTRACVV